jgi:hypothetical protein
MLKPALHWCSDSSVVNDLLVEPGRVRGNWGESYSTEKPRRLCQVRLLKWASASIGFPLLGYMNGHFIPRSFENWEKFVCLGNFMRNIRDKNKDPENRQRFTREQLLGNIDGIRFLGLFREKEKAYLGSFFFC